MIIINKHKLILEKGYSRNDLYIIFNVPENKQKGNWNTGYNTYNEQIFIFVNLEVAGRTGHDYGNKFIGDDLVWYSKKTHNINSDTIKNILNIDNNSRYFFVRKDNKDTNFIYKGHGELKEVFNTTPVKIIWDFSLESVNDSYEYSISEKNNLYEGAFKKVYVNSYERNQTARKKCIEHHSCRCLICGFDFYKVYGDIGKDYITVHHLTPLSDVRKEYEVDPINDLIPVCSNCHAMLHRKQIPYTPEELLELIRQKMVNNQV